MGEMEVSLEEPRYPIGGTTKLGTKVNPQMEACTGIPMYDGQPVEVGPRARLVTYKDYDEKGTVGQNVAREMEYPDCFYEMIDCLDALNTNGKVVADYIPDGDGSLGWASNEAPRGTDVHLARVKDWKVQYLQHARPDHLELRHLQRCTHRCTLAARRSYHARVRPLCIMCNPHDRARRRKQGSGPEAESSECNLMLQSEIVIVGCGNPLFGDDGFGPAVIEEMEKITLPDNVTIQDGGAGAPHFIFNFLNPEVTKKLIVVDIADFNAKPGSISRITGKDLKPGAYIDPHSWDGVDHSVVSVNRSTQQLSCASHQRSSKRRCGS